MGEIISQNEDDNVVKLGDGRPSQVINYQLAQEFYKEISGRSERMEKVFTTNFILELNCIRNLHQKSMQLLAQYNTAHVNCFYDAEYIDGSREKWSSFERFELHAPTKDVAITELNIQYKFLIILPQLKRPQEYIINLRFMSKTAKAEEIKKETEALPYEIPLVALIGLHTVKISISYVDYSVATALMSVTEKWVSGLNTVRSKSKINFLQRNLYIPKILTMLTIFGLTFYFIYVCSALIESAINSNLQHLALFLSAALFVIVFSFRLSDFIYAKAQNILNSFFDVSYINLCKADMRVAEQAENSFSKTIVKSILTVAGSLIIGVVASVIANNIS